jgi:hypothetical protein
LHEQNLVRPANRRSNTDRLEPGDPYRGSSVPVSSIAIDAADGDDEQLLACDMIEVHGAAAATMARDNVRAAALAGQRPQARHWIRVLEIIQRRRTSEDTPIPRSHAQSKDNGNGYFPGKRPDEWLQEVVERPPADQQRR